ncbi:MAG: glutaredoxin family protein [Syntrophaceae bacterium]|nr:glutaredoxin family protein [Syntrophaceae bacterium]
MKKYLLLFILSSVFLCQTAVADFYKWVDEKGETQITDYPPPPDKAAKGVEIQKTETEPPKDLENADDSSKIKAKKKTDVIIYTKNDCPDCDKARDFLNSKNIPFTEYNMDKNASAVEKRKEIDSDEDVPFAIINRNHVHGFSESVYDRVLQMEP